MIMNEQIKEMNKMRKNTKLLFVPVIFSPRNRVTAATWHSKKKKKKQTHTQTYSVYRHTMRHITTWSRSTEHNTCSFPTRFNNKRSKRSTQKSAELHQLFSASSCFLAGHNEPLSEIHIFDDDKGYVPSFSAMPHSGKKKDHHIMPSASDPGNGPRLLEI